MNDYLKYLDYRDYQNNYVPRSLNNDPDPNIKYYFASDRYSNYLDLEIIFRGERFRRRIAIPSQEVNYDNYELLMKDVNIDNTINNNKTFSEKLNDFTNSLSNEELAKFISLIKKNEK